MHRQGASSRQHFILCVVLFGVCAVFVQFSVFYALARCSVLSIGVHRCLAGRCRWTPCRAGRARAVVRVYYAEEDESFQPLSRFSPSAGAAGLSTGRLECAVQMHSNVSGV